MPSWKVQLNIFFLIKSNFVETGKVSSMEKDKGFQIQLLQTELEEERKRNKIDLSALDRELKSDYEARLRAEMTGLRKVYEEQTEKAKHEYMNLHSAKVGHVES